MWIIRTRFIGKDKMSISNQEEKFNDDYSAKIGYDKILRHWHDVICQKVIVSNSVLHSLNESHLILKTIQFNLALFDSGYFEITKEEINEE